MDLSVTLIDRINRLFADKGLVTFNTKETVIELNNVKIEAFPSHHLDAMRCLPNLSFILLDEADYPELSSIILIQKSIGNEELVAAVNMVMTTKDKS